jgi:thiol:disulfide interchange protein DsbD
VNVSLVSEVSSLRPGAPFSVAIVMKMAAGWHTYWKNPGESGVATRVMWTLPDFFRASDLAWPAPKRYEDGDLVLYGYADEAIFLTEVTPPRDLPSGRMTVAARLNWLECRDICIPGRADIDLAIPVGDGAIDASFRSLFARARAALPRETGVEGVSYRVLADKLSLVLRTRVPVASPVEFFPETPRVVDPRGAQKLARQGRALTLSVRRAEGSQPPPVLAGVLSVGQGASRQTYRVAAPLADVRAH